MESFVRGVIRKRWWVLGLCLVITALSIANLSRAVISTSIGRMFLGENPKFDVYLEASERFGSDLVFAIAVEDPDAFSPAGLKRLETITAELRKLPNLERVGGVLDARRLEPGPPPFGVPRAVRYADDAANSDATQILKSLAADPHYGGTLVGKDGASVAIYAHLKTDADRSAEQLPEIVDRVEAIFHEHYAPEVVHLAGFPVVTAEVMRQTQGALVMTTPIVGIVLLLTVWVLFRRLTPAALSLLVAGIAATWTMSLAVLIEPQLNMLSAFVPALILIISFSDVVHLCSAYLLELEAGHEKEPALVAACSEVGRACLFTSLTTGLGFLCLALVPTPAFRVLGVVLGCGVGLALLLAVTLTPILFSLVRPPKPLRQGATTGVQAGIDRLLLGMQTLSTGRPKSVIAAFALLTGLSLAGASQLTIETDFAQRLSPGSVVRVDQEWFDGRFVGATVIQVYVSGDAKALSDPAAFRKLAAFQAEVRKLPGVERAACWVDLVSVIYRATPAGQANPGRALPQDDATLSFLLNMVLKSGSDELGPFVDRSSGQVRMLVNVHGHAMRAVSDKADQIEALGTAQLGPGRVNATGLPPLLGAWLDEIVIGQRNGVVVSIVMIAILMMIGLRSFRVGLGSMIPNLIPLGVVVGCLGVFWDKVDSDCIAIVFVALGIGVDDTIHFLSRFRLESARTTDRAEAITRTYDFAGRAIFMTTTILALGLLPLLLSDYFLMRLFGSMLPVCFVFALLADLLLVPAMAQLGWLRFPSEPALNNQRKKPSAPKC